jgi:DNA-directed RNA polymerase specialized sigma24 family protein
MLLTTDTDLARRALSGDRDAFSRIFDASLPCVWSYAARHARRRASVELLTERILARVFLELDRYDGEVPFAAWLLSLCKETSAPSPPTSARREAPAKLGGYPRSRR